MGATDRMLLRYPELAVAADVPQDVRNLAEDIASVAAGRLSGEAAERPAASALVEGFWYWAIDAEELSYCVPDGAGFAWVQPGGSGASGAMELVAESALSSAGTFDFTSIPQDGKELLLELVVRSNRAGSTSDSVNLLVNNDGGANYDSQDVLASGTAVSTSQVFAGSLLTIGNAPAASSPAGVACSIEVRLPDYASTVWQKVLASISRQKMANSSGQMRLQHMMHFWRSAAAINRLTITPNIGTNFVAGSVARLYKVGG